MTMTLSTNTLLSQAPVVLNIGIDGFNESISQHGGQVEHLPWRPPGNADPLLAWKLARLMGDARISAANAEACKRIIQSRPMWEDIAMRADDVWPEMKGTRLLLHAGPPVAWDAMCGPMHGAMVGAVLYEGWAKTPEQAQKMLARGDIEFAQCHDFGAVGPMTGIISASMPLIQVRDVTHGNVAYTNINEGIGRCLRFGANGPDVLQKLKWFEDVLAPVLKAAVRRNFDKTGGIDLKAIQSQALLMGDEVHSRNAASTALFFMALAVPLAAEHKALSQDQIHQSLDFVAKTSQFFLNYSMASCKAIMDAAHGVLSIIQKLRGHRVQRFGVTGHGHAHNARANLAYARLLMRNAGGHDRANAGVQHFAHVDAAGRAFKVQGWQAERRIFGHGDFVHLQAVAHRVADRATGQQRQRWRGGKRATA